MTTFETQPPKTNGNGQHTGPGIGERFDNIGSNAHKLWDDARGAVNDISERLDLKGRVDRNPYATVAVAVGVGYVLGGGLFTPLTGRIFRLGMRLAAIPLVKDELVHMAETIVDGITRQSDDSNPGVRQ
jgi:hypothetical protein